MPTVKVPDLADGPVVIRHAGDEPFEVTAKGNKIVCSDEQVPAVLAAFSVAEVQDSKTPKES